MADFNGTTTVWESRQTLRGEERSEPSGSHMYSPPCGGSNRTVGVPQPLSDAGARR